MLPWESAGTTFLAVVSLLRVILLPSAHLLAFIFHNHHSSLLPPWISVVSYPFIFTHCYTSHCCSLMRDLRLSHLSVSSVLFLQWSVNLISFCLARISCIICCMSCLDLRSCTVNIPPLKCMLSHSFLPCTACCYQHRPHPRAFCTICIVDAV